jgi:hypothetical protein
LHLSILPVFEKYQRRQNKMENSHLKICCVVLLISLFHFTFGQDTIRTANDSVKNIKEITIIGQRKAVKIENGKTILDLQNSSMFGSKLIDAMQVVPGIQIDRANKNLTFENKNIQLFVDGSQIQIPSESIYSYIQSIPTSTIKQIEFDSHPGAKYDAGSQDAIINITTKKEKKNHLGFNPYVNYTKSKYYNYNYGASLFGNWKNIDFLLNYENYYEKIFNDKVSQDVYYKNLSQEIDYTRNDVSNEIGKGRYQNINGTVGYKTQNNDFIFSYLRTAADPTKTNALQTTDLIKNPNDIQQFTTEKYGRQTNNSSSYTAVYNHRFDTLGTALKVFFDHTDIKYRNNVNQNYFGFEKDSANVQKIGTDAKLNTFRMDFNNKNEAKYYIETGFKYSWTENKFQNFSSSFNDYQFAVNENIMSSYFSVRRKWKNFNATLGIRGENTLLKGDYLDNLSNEIQTVNKENYRIFPNIFLEYLWKKNSLALIADTKIQRPSYGQYNPLEIINDPYSVSRGNPVLLAASVYNYTLKYTFNKKYSFSAFFTNIKDQVGNIVVSNENNISVTEPVNLDYSNYYGISAGGNFDLKKWWSVSYWAQWSNVDKKGTLSEREINVKARNSYYLSLNQQFKLPKDYMLNLNAYISGNATWGAVYEQKNAWGEISLNAKKEFFNKKLSIELFANDILNTNSKLSVNYQDDFYRSKFVNHYPGRSFGIGIGYNFNTKIEKIEVDTDTEVKNRAK